MGAFKVPVTRSGYVIVLSKELKSPLAPQSDEEKMEADKSAAEKPKAPPEVDECSPDAPKSGGEPAKEPAGKDSDKQSPQSRSSPFVELAWELQQSVPKAHRRSSRGALAGAIVKARK